jgi:hypothetical protein
MAVKASANAAPNRAPERRFDSKKQERAPCQSSIEVTLAGKIGNPST